MSVILYSVMSMLATRGKRLHLIRKQLETNRITTRWNHWNEMNGTVCIHPRTVFLELFVSFKVLNGRHHPTVGSSSSELHFNGAKIWTVSEYWRSNQLQQIVVVETYMQLFVTFKTMWSNHKWSFTSRDTLHENHIHIHVDITQGRKYHS